VRRAVIVALALCGACGDDDAPSSRTLTERLLALGAVPCAELPDHLCVAIDVPLDRADPAAGSMTAAFAVRPASGPPEERIGLLVTAQGGPGYSGIAWADDYAYVDPAIAARFDLVFFDLRGLFASGDLNCPAAAAAYFHDGWRATTPAAIDEVTARAATFGAACVAEMDNDPRLPHLTTAEAVADLDAFRAAVDEPTLTLYGLSYGTQFAQAYATAFPAHTRAVLIDGVVDMTLTDLDYAEAVVRADNEVLARVLAACADEPSCADALGGDPVAAFDDLAAMLEAAPVTVDYPAAGGTEPRLFGRAELDSVAYIELDAPAGRRRFLQALIAAHGGDYLPLMGELYVAWLDAETEATLQDPTYADAGYYLFTCNDYGHGAGDGDQARQAAWRARLDALLDEPSQRVLHALGGDLPCATWPTAPPAPIRPAPYAAPAPTMLINADADIATPFAQGDGIYRRLDAAGAAVAAVTVRGGHHVMLGASACINAPVTAFLLAPDDARTIGETVCAERFVRTP
jgi:pimeloyl-ACP methyl ester carboxylesterase